MKIILFENKSDDWLSNQIKSSLAEHNFHVVKVDDQKTSINQQLYLSGLSDKKLDAGLIIIPITLGKVYSNFSGLQLGLMIRLSFEFPKYCRLPILFLGVEPIDDLYKYSHFAPFLNTKGVNYCNYNILEINKKISKSEELTINQIKDIISSDLILQKPSVSLRHSLINEWAIYRLALYLDCVKSTEKFSQFENLLNDPFYKLLLNQVFYGYVDENKDNLKSTLFKYKTQKIKLFVIDDKAKIGWSLVLENLFLKLNAKNSLIEYSTFDSAREYDTYEKEILKLIETHNPNLILLDLRLFREEEYLNFPNLDDIKQISGYRLLDAIKNFDPSLQVIIFTASQQAWNLKNLIDLGADGYFLKDSPDNYLSPSLYIKNLERFIQDIIALSKRGEILSWFYRNSIKIKHHLKILTWNNNIKIRIEEKLDIAFSLLLGKRTEFDKKFLYTDYELVFLVYWSCLNEFQSEMIGHYNGRDPNFKFKSGKDLIINSTSLIEYIPTNINLISPGANVTLRNTPKWVQRFGNNKPMPNVNMLTTVKSFTLNELRYFRDMSNLIPSYIYLETPSSMHHMVDEFLYLNEIRNRLDFTHSDKNIIRSQSIVSARDQEQSLEDCKDMFKLIYFLLTETEVK